MAIFNISRLMLSDLGDYYNFNPLDRTRPENRSRMGMLVTWLAENVGPFYGSGQDNVKRIGSGWEIYVLYNGHPVAPDNEDCEVTWHIDITDEAKSTLFALKWIN